MVLYEIYAVLAGNHRILGFFAILRFLPPFLGDMATMRIVQVDEAHRLM